MSLVPLCSVNDLWPGEMKRFEVPMLGPVLLIALRDRIVAYQDRCPHMGVSLAEGARQGQTLICAAHGWQFDILTGKGVNPSTSCLKAFEVNLLKGNICVFIDSFEHNER